jgi:hypothetical protein
MYGFIAERVAPLIEVAEKSSRYPVFNRENYLKRRDIKRAPGGRYNEFEFAFSDASYSCQEHGLEGVCDDSEVKKWASFFDYEVEVMNPLQHSILLEHEARVASLVFNDVTYTVNAASGKWSAVATDIPGDINTRCLAITQQTGIPKQMMSLVVSALTFWRMNRNTAINDQVKYTFSANQGVRPFELTTQQMAAVLGIKEIIVGGSVADTKPEGETPVLAGLWSDTRAQIAVLAQPRGRWNRPSAWRTALWTADSPVSPVVESYRDDSRRGNVIRVRHDTDELLSAEANLLNQYINIDP